MQPMVFEELHLELGLPRLLCASCFGFGQLQGPHSSAIVVEACTQDNVPQ